MPGVQGTASSGSSPGNGSTVVNGPHLTRFEALSGTLATKANVGCGRGIIIHTGQSGVGTAVRQARAFSDGSLGAVSQVKSTDAGLPAALVNGPFGAYTKVLREAASAGLGCTFNLGTELGVNLAQGEVTNVRVVFYVDTRDWSPNFLRRQQMVGAPSQLPPSVSSTAIPNPGDASAWLALSSAGTSGGWPTAEYAVQAVWVDAAGGRTLPSNAVNVTIASAGHCIRVAAINAANTPDTAVALQIFVRGLLSFHQPVTSPGASGSVATFDISLDTTIGNTGKMLLRFAATSTAIGGGGADTTEVIANRDLKPGWNEVIFPIPPTSGAIGGMPTLTVTGTADQVHQQMGFYVGFSARGSTNMFPIYISEVALNTPGDVSVSLRWDDGIDNATGIQKFGEFDLPCEMAIIPGVADGTITPADATSFDGPAETVETLQSLVGAGHAAYSHTQGHRRFLATPNTTAGYASEAGHLAIPTTYTCTSFTLDLPGGTTGAITFSGTPATLATNIQTAVRAVAGHEMAVVRSTTSGGYWCFEVIPTPGAAATAFTFAATFTDAGGTGTPVVGKMVSCADMTADLLYTRNWLTLNGLATVNSDRIFIAPYGDGYGSQQGSPFLPFWHAFETLGIVCGSGVPPSSSTFNYGGNFGSNESQLSRGDYLTDQSIDAQDGTGHVTLHNIRKAIYYGKRYGGARIVLLFHRIRTDGNPGLSNRIETIEQMARELAGLRDSGQIVVETHGQWLARIEAVQPSVYYA